MRYKNIYPSSIACPLFDHSPISFLDDTRSDRKMARSQEIVDGMKRILERYLKRWIFLYMAFVSFIELDSE